MSFDKQIEVKTVSLDSWTKENNIEKIDLIWVDVQGAERDVIEGAKETLKNVHYFFTEYGETSTYPEAMTREETIILLNELGFEIIPRYSSKKKVGDLLLKNTRI